MDSTVSCLVDAHGKVYVTGGAESQAEVAADFGLHERQCQEVRFDLAHRRFLADRPTPFGDNAARMYLDQSVGTPERLMTFAEDGHLPKGVLVGLLAIENRQPYLEACANIEKEYTEECTARNDPCLESGCAVEGETCLQPLLGVGIEYHKACAAEWIKVFRRPENRIDAWRD